MTNQLNITAGTDVLLHVSLEHEGVTIDPSVIEDLSATLVSGLGKRTTLEASVEADYIVVSVPWVEGRVPGCYSLKLSGSINSLAWACVGKSLIKYTSGTEPGVSEVTVEGDTYDVTMEVGYHYTDTPINAVGVTVDGGVGIPSADVDYHNMELDFVFHDIKGETGDRGNGIASIETTESTEDGGINTVTITDDDGSKTYFNVMNGRTGKQGDSAVYNPDDPDTPDFEMANTTGQSTTKAMTQKAVTDAVSNYADIDLTGLSTSGTIIDENSNKWVSSSVTKCVLLRVTPGDTIHLLPKSGAGLFYAFLSSASQTIGQSADFADGYSNVVITQYNAGIQTLTVPGNASRLYIVTILNGGDRTPSVLRYVRYVKDTVLDIEAKYDGLLLEHLSEFTEVNNSFNTTTFISTELYQHARIPAAEGDKFIVKAPSSQLTYVAFVTSTKSTGDIPFVDGMTTAVKIADGKELILTAPSGTKYILVYNGGNARPFNVWKMAAGGTSAAKQKSTIRLKLGFGNIDKEEGTYYWTGATSAYTTNFEAGRVACSNRFVKTSAEFQLNVKNNFLFAWVFFYDENFQYLGYSEHYKKTFDITESGYNKAISSGYNYSYIKIHIRNANNEPYQMPYVSLTGVFDADWDTYNPRPNNGKARISLLVNVSNRDCANDDSQEIQDNPQYYPNYGAVELPENYSVDGEPTRLIIYSHGASIHYNINTAGLNTGDVEPEYWLKEGYAVMDVDGNPYEATSHAFIPAALDCYIAAYNWVIEHFNIKRDGVFLGGRSMGGGNTLHLLKRQCPIPVLAACANNPTAVAFSTSASYRNKVSNWIGYKLPDGFAWSAGTSQVQYNEDELDVILDNWNKFISCASITPLVVDFPTDETWRRNFALSCKTNDMNRVTLMQGLHAIARAPIKLFGSYEDPNNNWQTTTGLYYTMLGNSGQIVEMRMFHSDSSTYPVAGTAHTYDLLDPALRTTMVTRYGEEVENVPVVYVEMLRFWRRFEQE